MSVLFQSMFQSNTTTLLVNCEIINLASMPARYIWPFYTIFGQRKRIFVRFLQTAKLGLYTLLYIDTMINKYASLLYLELHVFNETTSVPRYKNITVLSTFGEYSHECDGCLLWGVEFQAFIALTFLNHSLKTRN